MAEGPSHDIIINTTCSLRLFENTDPPTLSHV